MDGNDFIRLAGKLAAVPSADEATYRTAVSRAYYGAFHLGRSFLIELGIAPVRNANIHAFVRHCLDSSNHHDACQAASHLSHLQAARNLADYELKNPHVGSRSQAMVSVERAAHVASAIEKCQSVDAREAIRRAISEYQQKLRPR